MRLSAMVALVGVLVVGFLGGCASGTQAPPQPRSMPRFEPPAQPGGSLRLYIYRPQGIVGMWGRPVILINGQQLVNTHGDSLLEPNSVFVADVSAEGSQVSWIQSRQNKVSAEPIEVSGTPGSTVYLRWTLKPTYGYLQKVSESEASSELGTLFFIGYRNLTGSAK